MFSEDEIKAQFETARENDVASTLRHMDQVFWNGVPGGDPIAKHERCKAIASDAIRVQSGAGEAYALATREIVLALRVELTEAQNIAASHLQAYVDSERSADSLVGVIEGLENELDDRAVALNATTTVLNGTIKELQRQRDENRDRGQRAFVANKVLENQLARARGEK